MAKRPTPATPHRWSFYRAGGVDQVRLDRGEDVFNLDLLDQKLWVALSCPVKGLELDSRTLELLDTDGDGFVRPPEILAAVRWLRDALQSADSLVKGEDGVALTNFRKDTAEGLALLASARHILQSLGSEAAVITVADTQKTAEVFARARRNGDGIVPPETVDDEWARGVAADIVACMSGATDRSGRPGYDQKQLDAFFAACAEYVAWQGSADSDSEGIMPRGEGTGAAYAALTAVRAKIDDYFGRTRLAAYDPRALAAVNREEAAYMSAAAKDLTITASEVMHFPLALVEANKPLSLTGELNPAWAGVMADFKETCCKDRDSLTQADWESLCAQFAGYGSWLSRKAGTLVEKLGGARIAQILASDAKAALQRAIDEDLAVAGQVEAMSRVEKLARLHRDFHKLLNNYVSFSDFYARRGAIFQAGRLFLDGRACDMCFHVNDAAKHAKMAPMSNCFLAYVDCTRPGGEKMSVACAFTAGDSDYLFEGRNGIFYDRQGRDWNATIARVVSSPISIRQGFWSPYKKVLRGIQETIAKKAAAAEEAAHARLATSAAAPGVAPPAAPAAGGPAKPKFDIGVVAALGVAVGGLSTALAGLFGGFLSLGPWIPVGIAAVLLAISGPSMFIAWLKLRQRNLGPILDANGWAVNTLTRVNVPLGGSLTALPKIPAGSERTLTDPYAPKKSPWPKVLVFLLLVAAVGYGLYRYNLLHKWFPDHIPEYVSASFEGETEAVAGGEDAIVKLGSGAVFVTVAGLEGVSRLDVNAASKSISVPMKGAVAGSVITLTDGSTAKPQTFTIRVLEKK